MTELKKIETIEKEMAEEIAAFFQENYPECHDLDEREQDIQAHSSIDNLRMLLKERVIYILYDEIHKVVGYMEWSSQSVRGAIYEFIHWLIVHKEKRKSGYATMLHELFEQDVKLLQSPTPDIPVAQLLAVHTENSAKAMYAKWGYEIRKDLASDKKVFMMKIVFEDKFV